LLEDAVAFGGEFDADPEFDAYDKMMPQVRRREW
jgi:hypothetical protein